MKRLLFVILSVFLAVSCGKTKQAETKTSTKVEAKTSAKTTNNAVTVDSDGVAIVTITTSDVMKFSVKKFTIKAGQKVRLTLTHTGKLDKKIMGHNVVILQKGVKRGVFASKAAAASKNDYIPEDDSGVIAHTKMIGGGETTTVEFTAPAIGSYEFICSFPAHYAIMKGKMIVE